jgi:dienelactone hydrolase
MARLGVDLDAVVSYHRALGSPIKAEAGKVQPRIHVYTGGADKMVPSDQVFGLVKERQDAEADLTLVSLVGPVWFALELIQRQVRFVKWW